MDLRHYLKFSDFSLEEYEYLFARTRWIKDKFKRYERYQPLVDRTLAMVFEKHSTRTRVSFEAGFNQLGGSVITLMTRDTQMGRGEPIEDVARVVSRCWENFAAFASGRLRASSETQRDRVPPYQAGRRAGLRASRRWGWR